MGMNLNGILKKIFKDDPAPTVIIHGKKFTGKTDFSLALGEKCLELGYVQEVGTNIKTDKFSQIDSYVKLKKWLRSTTKSKLFIFDEAGVHLHARRSMSKANVNFLKLAHLIRKYRCKWILITVRFKDLDPGLRDPEICTAIIEKLGKKVAKIYITSEEKIYIVTDIPRTKIMFDTYQIAEFSFEEEEEEIPENILEDKEIYAAFLYAKTGRLDVVRKTLELGSFSTAKTYIRRGIIKALLKIYTLQEEEKTSNNVQQEVNLEVEAFG